MKKGFARLTPEKRIEAARNGGKRSRGGFAKIDPKRQREIASMGGKRSWEKGTAHKWTSEEASLAGKIGGAKSKRKKEEMKGGETK